jgi:hypothetical protein
MCPALLTTTPENLNFVPKRASFRNAISIAKGGNHEISFTSAVGPQIARHNHNLPGGRLDDAIKRGDERAAARRIGHS